MPESGIRKLRNNILFHLQQLMSESTTPFHELVLNNKVSPFINYLIGGKKIVAPYVLINEKTIAISENFSTFLWSLIYSTWVYYEEEIMKSEMTKLGQVHPPKDNEVVQSTENMRIWLQNFIKSPETTQWEKDLPNPNAQNQNANVNWYSEKVNGIFVESMCIFIFHEIEHLVGKHQDIHQSINDPRSGDYEYNVGLKKETEKEADLYAVYRLLENTEDDEERVFLKSITILLTFMCPFFLIKSLTGITPEHHIQLDVRVTNILETLNIKSDKYQFYLFAFGNILLEYFFFIHRATLKELEIERPNKNDFGAETAKEVYYQFLEIIDRIVAIDPTTIEKVELSLDD